MARIRTIKPDFWTDETIVELEFWERLLFIGLWNFADDQGFISYSPKRIKMQVFPADDIDVSRGLQRLLEVSLLESFDVQSVEGGVVLRIRHWDKHQKVSNAAQPKYQGDDLQVRPSNLPLSGILASPLEPYPAEGKGREGKGREKNSPSTVPNEPHDDPGSRHVTSDDATASAPKTLDEYFEEFWDAYPRCVGKGDARRAWDRARRKVSIQAILAGAQKLASDPNLPEKQFIPHPATWLNRGGWDDEAYPKPDGAPGQTAAPVRYHDDKGNPEHSPPPPYDPYAEMLAARGQSA